MATNSKFEAQLSQLSHLFTCFSEPLKYIRSYYFSPQNGSQGSHHTQRSQSPSLPNCLQGLTWSASFVSFLTSSTSFLICRILITQAFLNKPRILLIQGLCICSFVLECSLPRSLFSYFLQIFAQKLPSSWAYKFPFKNAHSLQHHYAVFLPHFLHRIYHHWTYHLFASFIFKLVSLPLPPATHTLECKLQDSGTYIYSVLSTAIS